MQVVTWKEWCDIKKARDMANEEHFKKLTIKKCACGNIYSYEESWQKDPGICANCRGEG